MNSKTPQELQYFKEKICTIIVPGINRAFNEQVSRQYFTGQVKEISADGIWVMNVERKTMSFFNMVNVISICEEQWLDPNKPEHKEILQEYKQRTGHELKSDLNPTTPLQQKPPAKPQDGSFVNIDELSNLAKQTKEIYTKID